MMASCRPVVPHGLSADKARICEPGSVRLLARREERTRSYEEAREDVREALRRNREEAALTRWFERQLAEAEVEYVRE